MRHGKIDHIFQPKEEKRNEKMQEKNIYEKKHTNTQTAMQI